jgi:glycine cleavage system pyridoxal-binding protein P
MKETTSNPIAPERTDAGLPGNDSFVRRHIGPRLGDYPRMLEALGLSSLDELIDQAVPSAIRLARPLNLGDGSDEYSVSHRLREIASHNRIFRSFSAASSRIPAGTRSTLPTSRRSRKGASRRC